MPGWAERLSLPEQRGVLFCWVPVCLGIGIGIYFALPVEPARLAWMWVGGAVAAGVVLTVLGLRRQPVFMALLLALCGVGLAGLRTAQVDAPILGFRYYGAVEGRVIHIDRSASNMPRLTLDRVVLERMDPDRTPKRVRVSLHGDQAWLDPEPGQTIIVTAHLSPPPGPVEPGGFDFRRMAYFDRLGALGYARTPALLLEPADGSAPIARMRAAIGDHVRRVLPGETGEFAVAITTGDRSGMGAETLQNLRDSNLAHLLAISGLHMGLLTGVVFGMLRVALALSPDVSLRLPTKKIAAVGALAAAAFYLSLSGGNVATQRAFLMVSVMLVGVLMDRRALSLHAVAVAAVIVLAMRPETLGEPGFQMSFAATVALVAAFRAARTSVFGRLPKWAKGAAGLVLSSAVAGFATAPISATHFNQMSQLGLLANLSSVPMMGIVVMPGAVVAAFLSPLGLSWIGLGIMAPGIEWILWVARAVASIDGAVRPVVSPPGPVLPLVAMAGLIFVLWRGPWRAVAVAPAVVAGALWVTVERPAVMIAENGGLVGVRTAEGLALSKDRGQGFAAGVWLENDGDSADQATAAARSDWPVTVGGVQVHHAWGRGWDDQARAVCGAGRIVVSSQPMDPPGACLWFDPEVLRDTGAVALYREGGGFRVETVAERSGRRPWSGGPGQEDVPEIEAGDLVVASQ